jgi:DNA-binding IclR family transcriptional regulator
MASGFSRARCFVSDTSNPTSRVLDVINFLASHPTETFTLAEIARQVGLSNGSAHRILTTMAEADFLSRNEKHKTYSLGIALVAAGEAAIAKHQGIEIARREVARLAVELNALLSVTAIANTDLLLVAKEGSPQSHKGLNRVGERQPMVPPVGLCHIAWSNEQTIHAYVEKASPYMSESMRAHLLDAFPIIRRRGYSIAAFGPNIRKLREIMIVPVGQIRDDAYWSSVFELTGQLSAGELQLLNLDDAATDGISYISAPVFSPQGNVAFELVINGMPNYLSVKEIEQYAEKLCATAAIITSETRGRAPKI